MSDLKFPICIGADVHSCAVSELLDADIFILVVSDSNLWESKHHNGR